jgi:hypothetical protein
MDRSGEHLFRAPVEEQDQNQHPDVAVRELRAAIDRAERSE